MPQRIAGQHETTLPRVPKSEGEHAAQGLDHGRPAVAIELQQHLGVGMRAEPVTLGQQLRAQFGIVVDLTVERNRERAVVAVHRLGAEIGKLDDGQPPVGEADPPVLRMPVAAAVGAAWRHARIHARKLGSIDPRGDVQVGVYAGDATHDGQIGWTIISGRRCRR